MRVTVLQDFKRLGFYLDVGTRYACLDLPIEKLSALQDLKAEQLQAGHTEELFRLWNIPVFVIKKKLRGMETSATGSRHCPLRSCWGTVRLRGLRGLRRGDTEGTVTLRCCWGRGCGAAEGHGGTGVTGKWHRLRRVAGLRGRDGSEGTEGVRGLRGSGETEGDSGFAHSMAGLRGWRGQQGAQRGLGLQLCQALEPIPEPPFLLLPQLQWRPGREQRSDSSQQGEVKGHEQEPWAGSCCCPSSAWVRPHPGPPGLLFLSSPPGEALRFSLPWRKCRCCQGQGPDTDSVFPLLPRCPICCHCPEELLCIGGRDQGRAWEQQWLQSLLMES